MYSAHSWWFPDADTHFSEMLAKNIKKGGEPIYQGPVRKLSIAVCPNKNLALDIGANVGLWSKDLCEAFTHVIAFEPVAEFRECLLKNVTSNNLTIEPCALGSENSKINMIITQGNTGHSHVDSASIGNGTIEMRTLDSMSLPKFDYVKIDCEGYEFKILLGAEQSIRAHKPIIVVEQKFHLDTGIVDKGEAVELLKSWGAVTINQVRNDLILGWN